MQSKTRWAIVAVLAIAIASGAAFFLLQDEPAEPETAITSADAAAPAAASPEELAPAAETAPESAADEEGKPSEQIAAAFPSATDRRERTGRGRIYGKATMPADGPRGLPIEVALHRVPAYDAVEFDYESTLAGTATAGQDGSYEFKSLPIGTYVLLATATGYTMNGAATLTVERPEREVTLSLVPGAGIAGRVINDAGEPVEGARVFVAGWDIQGQKRFAPRDRSLASQTLTDEAGAFTTVNLRTSLNNEPGYQLAVKAEGYATFISDYIRAGTQGLEFIIKPGGIVSGMLVNVSDGAPLASKTVLLASELAIENISGTTDTEGFFFLTDVPAGTHKPGLRDDALVLVPQTPSIQVVDGMPVDEVVLQAAEGGRIAGRVFDRESGNGIGEVQLYAYATENEGGTRRQINSGADGAYEFKGLSAGAYRVEYRKPDGYPDARYEDPDRERLVTVDVAKRTDGVDFALTRGLTISGRVVDESGKPLGEASVNGNASQGNAYDYVQTKADGTFVLAGFSPQQQVSVSASKQGYAMVSSKQARGNILKIEEEPLSGVEIVMGAESSVSGTVVDAAGRPLPNMEVYIYRLPNGGGPGETSSADGSIKFAQLSEGEYGFIFPQGSGWSSSDVAKSQKVKVAKAQHITGLKIVFEDPNKGGLTISGRVVDTKGNGIARAEVRLQGPWREVTADATGNYTMAGLTPGSYTLVASHYSYTGMEMKQADAGAKNVDFALKGMATVSGRVVSAATNQPVTAFRVRATGRDGQQYYVRDEFQSVLDAEGRFKLSQVEDGSTTIEIRADGFADAQAKITPVVENETREDVVVRMEDGVVVAGRVIDGSGKGVSGAQIFIGAVPQQWQMERQRRGLSGGDGSFRLTSLPSGQAEISAAHSSFASRTVSVNLVPRIENKVDIVLSAGGTIEGRITENGRTPLAGQYVYANINNDHRQAQTDADGRYTLAGLPDGKINVGANLQMGSSNRSQNVTVDVKDGFVTEVNFDFRAGNATIEGVIYIEPGVPVGGQTWVNGTITTATGTTESYGTQTGPGGTYRLEGMVAGTLALRVFGQQGANKRISLSIAEGTHTEKDILLYGGSTVHVSVSGAGPQSSVILVTGAVSMTEFSMQRVQELYQDMVSQAGIVNGEASMTSVDPGQYTAVAVSIDPAAMNSGDPYSGAKWGTAPVSVEEGKEATVRIDL